MALRSHDSGLEVGPRGRSLCWVVLERLSAGPGASPFWRARFDLSPDRLLEVLRESLPAIDFAALQNPDFELVLLECVADSVSYARYWQEPDEVDVALSDPRVEAALAPVAEMIAAAPAAEWWAEPVDLAAQVFVDMRAGYPDPPIFQGAQTVLEVGREQATAPGKRHRGQWVGGPWWSTPGWSLSASKAERFGDPLPEIAMTTRSRPCLGAVGLLLEEDAHDAPAGLCWPVRFTKPTRVFEINEPQDWVDLVEEFGVDVTGRRIAHWSMASGLDRRWMLPDWLVVAEEYEAVHLTVNGYLTTSGRALPLCSGSATFLAGWHPDASYWLTDSVEAVAPATLWVSEEHHPERQWHLEEGDS